MDKVQTYDKERLHINIARLKKGGANFEIDIDPDKAVEFREGKDVDIKDILKAENIFSDVKKGLLASEERLKTLFETTDPIEIAKTILKQGEIQLTEEHRKKVREQKLKRIIDIIRSNGVNPENHLPHPAERIENAINEVNFKIDDFKTAENQIQDALKMIRIVLPIKFETKEIEVKIPSQYASKSYGLLKKIGKHIKDEWMDDGSLLFVTEIPGGLEQEFYDKLNAITQGNNEVNVLKTK